MGPAPLLPVVGRLGRVPPTLDQDCGSVPRDAVEDPFGGSEVLECNEMLAVKRIGHGKVSFRQVREELVNEAARER